ncbi:integrase [Klebsiella pneumoniae]|nr:integrase [Klebsiella pneumoniae]
MKMKRPHLVPLSTQALEIVQQLKVISGQYPLVFPGRNDPRKTMSEASINQVFKRIGYTGKVTIGKWAYTKLLNLVNFQFSMLMMNYIQWSGDAANLLI